MPGAMALPIRSATVRSPRLIWVAIDVWNTIPAAWPNSYRVHWGETLTASGALVALANDYDNDGDNLAAVVVTGPAHGNLQFNANGTFTYTPNGVFVGALQLHPYD